MQQSGEIQSHSYTELYLREMCVKRDLFLIDNITATWTKLQLVCILDKRSLYFAVKKLKKSSLLRKQVEIS